MHLVEVDHAARGVVNPLERLERAVSLRALLDPAEQRARGDHAYQLYSGKADERATCSGGTGTGGAADPGLRQILATLVDLP